MLSVDKDELYKYVFCEFATRGTHAFALQNYYSFNVDSCCFYVCEYKKGHFVYVCVFAGQGGKIHSGFIIKPICLYHHGLLHYGKTNRKFNPILHCSPQHHIAQRVTSHVPIRVLNYIYIYIYTTLFVFYTIRLYWNEISSWNYYETRSRIGRF